MHPGTRTLRVSSMEVRNHGVSRAFRMLLCAVSASLANAAPDNKGHSGELTRVDDIRALSRAEAARALPVRLRGVVTWQDADARPAFFLHDGFRNIWVDRSTADSRGLWRGGDPPREECGIGAVVELEGVTDPGGYAPCVVPTAFRKVGSGDLPMARKVPLERMLSGSEDGQLVEVEGVVQGVTPPDRLGDSKLMLMVEGHPCRVASENGRLLDPAKLVDARVLVRGILVPLPNLRAEVAGLRMNIMGPGDIDVLMPPPLNPFSAPRVPLDGLLPFSPDARPFHRKVTSGVVTLAASGRFFFIQDGNRSVRVQSDATDVSPGDQVEVAGFVETSRTLAAITGGVVRKLGRAPVPPPAEVPVARILHPEFRNAFEKVADSDYSGRLVRIQARMVGVERSRPGTVDSILVSADGEVFPVYLTNPAALIPSDWVEDAVLDLKGVVELAFIEDASTQGSFSISGMRMWLGSARDVWVIDKPSWWTPRRLWMALAGVLAVLTLALGWNLALSKLLQKRTRLLEDVMRKHRDSELEFEGARQERRRLAGDLHDGLQQLMAGAAYRMEAALAHLGKVPAAVEVQFAAARRALVRSQEGLREALWGLHHMEDDTDDFAALLGHAASTVEHWPRDAIEVTSEGPPHTLSRQVSGSLLMLMQESVGNAFKHGAATHVHVSVIYGADFLEMRIRDNGTGFNPHDAPGPKDGHFGLESARLRMRWLKGTLVVASEPGRGTTVSCIVPAFVAYSRSASVEAEAAAD
jgi:signal transduction histidine kinase